MQLIVSAVHQLDDSRQFGFRFNLDMNGADVRVKETKDDCCFLELEWKLKDKKDFK